MELWTILTNVAFLTTFYTIAWKFYTRKIAKLTEEQKARQEKNVADKGEFENLVIRMDFLEQKLKESEYESYELKKKLCGMQKFLSVQIGYKKFAESRVCTDLTCPDRVPELGSYHTTDELEKEVKKDVKKDEKV